MQKRARDGDADETENKVPRSGCHVWPGARHDATFGACVPHTPRTRAHAHAADTHGHTFTQTYCPRAGAGVAALDSSIGYLKFVVIKLFTDAYEEGKPFFDKYKTEPPVWSRVGDNLKRDYYYVEVLYA